METNYKVINGTAFHAETCDKVCEVLNSVLHTQQRVKIYYGDTETGRDWHELHDTQGTIGRSTGQYKIPLLMHNTRSIGGGAILDHCIVKIKLIENGRILYQNEKYVAPKISIVPSDLPDYMFNTIVDGEIYGRHKGIKSAQIVAARIR